MLVREREIVGESQAGRPTLHLRVFI